MARAPAGLVDRIYEAAVLPELWPAVLDEVREIGKGVLGHLFTISRGEMRSVTCPGMEHLVQEYAAEGWHGRTERANRLVALRHAGFVGDLDVFTLDEMERDPVYAGFFHPRGLGWGMASAISSPTGDNLMFSVERRLETGPVEPETVRALDALRPHLARSALLSGRLAMERARAAAVALDVIGLPAAVLSGSFRTMAANDRLQEMMPSVVMDRRERIALVDTAADVLLADALARLRLAGEHGGVRSIPIAAHAERPPYIVHVVPIRRAANDIFSSAAAIVIVTPVVPSEVPTAEVLQGLFDLTPAEARVARAVAERKSLDVVADSLGVSRETVRTQLKAALSKTGMGRQIDLAALLAGTSLRQTAR